MYNYIDKREETQVPRFDLATRELETEAEKFIEDHGLAQLCHAIWIFKTFEQACQSRPKKYNQYIEVLQRNTQQTQRAQEIVRTLKLGGGGDKYRL